MSTTTLTNQLPHRLGLVILIGLITLLAVGTTIADELPPPIVRSDADKRVLVAIEKLKEHLGASVSVQYSRAVQRPSMVIPQKFVEDAQYLGLLEEDKATSRRHVIVGLALSAFFVATGIFLFRRVSNTKSRVMLVILSTIGVIVVLTFSLQNSVVREPVTWQSDDWPKQTALGIDVTVVLAGDTVHVTMPERFRPPARGNRNREWNEHWKKDKDKDK